MTMPPPVPTMPLNYAKPLRNDLRNIAVAQRGIMLCILAYIGCFALAFLAPGPVKGAFALAAFACDIVAIVFVFKLSICIYSKGRGILLGIGVLIPLVGLLVLLMVNGKATKILREHGIHVGLIGAKVSEIPAPGTTTY